MQAFHLVDANGSSVVLSASIPHGLTLTLERIVPPMVARPLPAIPPPVGSEAPGSAGHSQAFNGFNVNSIEPGSVDSPAGTVPGEADVPAADDGGGGGCKCVVM